MIFVTVGTQLPFERLVEYMAVFASSTDERVVAQVGQKKLPSNWNSMEVYEDLSPDKFNEFFVQSRVIVAHAGIGTLLTARKFKKPLIVIPRKKGLNEHRNDHQVATAREIENIKGVYVANEVADIKHFLSMSLLENVDHFETKRRNQLIEFLHNETRQK
jgi:UDP-N-acetylglucosamine transferase subunit ALG13